MLYKEPVHNIETRNSITQPLPYYLSSSDFISAPLGSKVFVCVCVYGWVVLVEMEVGGFVSTKERQRERDLGKSDN